MLRERGKWAWEMAKTLSLLAVALMLGWSMLSPALAQDNCALHGLDCITPPGSLPAWLLHVITLVCIASVFTTTGPLRWLAVLGAVSFGFFSALILGLVPKDYALAVLVTPMVLAGLMWFWPLSSEDSEDEEEGH